METVRIMAMYIFFIYKIFKGNLIYKMDISENNLKMNYKTFRITKILIYWKSK